MSGKVKMRWMNVLAACFCTWVCVTGAWADEPKGPVKDAPKEAQPDAPKDPEAPAIFIRANRAIEKLDQWTFDTTIRGIGSKATRIPEVDATVRVAPLKAKRPAFPLAFRVEGIARWTPTVTRSMFGPDAKPGKDEATFPAGDLKFVTAWDGKTVRTVRPEQKVSIEGAWDERDAALRDGGGFALVWLLRWSQLVTGPFTGEEPTSRSRWEGVQTIDGVECDVVYADYSETNDPTLFEAWWWFARSDGLPRRVELNYRENTGDGFIVITIAPKESKEPVSEATLALARPEGFTVHESKAPAPRARGGGGPGLLAVGQPAPDFTLVDTAGKSHTLSEMRGKVVLLDFWATWCGPCRMVMPGLQKLHEQYGKDGLVVVGMNCWESGDAAKFMEEQKFTYLTLLKADDAAGQYKVSGIPTLYVVGKDGTIAHAQVGAGPGVQEKLGEKVAELLKAEAKPVESPQPRF